jgi:hypothetical protein
MKINTKISLYSLYLKTIKRQYIYSSIEDSEGGLVSERNNAGLKKLSQVLSEQTSDSSAFLNPMCLLKYVLNCEQHFSYFVLHYPTYELTVTGLPRVYCILLIVDNLARIYIYIYVCVCVCEISGS